MLKAKANTLTVKASRQKPEALNHYDKHCSVRPSGKWKRYASTKLNREIQLEADLNR